jgi:hypothetical protein
MPNYTIYYSEGTSNGPYDIFLSGSSGLTLYTSSVTQGELVAGYLISFPDGIPSSSIIVYDMAFGCATSENVIFPTPTPTITPTISVTPTKTPSISITPTKTPTITVTPSVTPTFTPPPSVTVTPTISVTPSGTPGATVSPTPSVTISRTPSTTPPTPITVSWTGVGGFATSTAVCVTANTVGAYTFYWSEFPVIGIGSVIYSTSSTCCPVNGGNQWFALGSPFIGIYNAYQINNAGVIIATGGSCIGLGII